MSDQEETNDTRQGDEEQPDEDDETPQHRVRDISESSNQGDVIMAATATSGMMSEQTDTAQANANLLGDHDKQPEALGGGASASDLNASTLPLQTKGPSSRFRKSVSQLRVTRFLYFYFMLGFFLVLFVCIVWGFLGISYFFYGYPGIGLAYFAGLFIPSLWAAIMLILDLIVWSNNRRHPHLALAIDIRLCCNRIQLRNGKQLTQSWYFIVFLYIWFGILLALPAGSWALPPAAFCLAVMTITVIADWDYYYVRGDYNGLYGVHANPWRFLLVSSVLQFLMCMVVVFGHFLFHWRCIYEPESMSTSERFNICHDWIPYEIMAIVYGLLIFVYFYKRFQGDPLNSNVMDRRVRYYLWFQAFLLLISIIWIIVEIFDGHVYVYDVIGFLYLWFVAPVFFVVLRKFKVR